MNGAGEIAHYVCNELPALHYPQESIPAGLEA